MLIVCPNCATSYRVETSSLGAAGRSVRCVRCRSVWFANDPAPLSAVTDTDRDEALTMAEQATVTEPSEQPDDGPQPMDPAAEAGPLPRGDDVAGDSEQASSAFDMSHEPTEADTSPPIPSLPEHAMLRSHEPVAVAPTPILTPPGHGDPSSLADAVVGEDIETVAARLHRRSARPRLRLPVPGLPVTIMALIAINTILIGWRADVVKVLPQTASLYAAIGLPVNLRGLTFSGVTTAIEAQDGVTVLVVEGAIASASNHTVEVPRLRFSVRNPKGQEIYAWTALPTRSVLGPGETLAFRSRLASPPPEGSDVAVRFFNRRDRVAGIQ